MHKKRERPINNEEEDGALTHHMLNVQEKWNVVAQVWRLFNAEKQQLPIDSFSTVASSLGKSYKTVHRVWNEYITKCESEPSKVPDLTPKPHGHLISGLEKNTPRLREAFVNSGGCFYYEEQAQKLHLPQTILFYWMKELGIQNSKSHIKPSLSLVQKCKRILYILHRLETPRLVEEYCQGEKATTKCSSGSSAFNNTITFRFSSFDDLCWIDEAFFYLKHLVQSTKTLPGVPEAAHDTVQSKTQIPKVMFLTLIALPRMTPTGNIFDGLVEICPLVTYVPAKRSSKNRSKGTMELKSTSMTGCLYMELLTKENGLFDCLTKKSEGVVKSNHHWTIQQDGAKPHVNKYVAAAISTGGYAGNRNIGITTQSAQSPDLMVLDLAFFSSLQSYARRIKYSVTSTEDFVSQVKRAFREYPVDKLLRCCALQLVAYREILKDCGGNQYEMPHTGIRLRQKHNVTISGIPGLYQDCGDYEVSGEVVKKAVEFYEASMNESFPWNKSPLYGHHDSGVDTGSSATTYFDPHHDIDATDDPTTGDHNEEDSADERDYESSDDF